MYFASVIGILVSILSAYYLNLFHQQPNVQLYNGNSELPKMATNEKGSSNLRILTQNMFMRPPLINNNGNDHKDGRLDYFIEQILPNYDVVCLQEMFEFASSRRSRLLAAADKLGFKYYVASDRQFLWNLAIDGGLVILSKYPIVSTENIIYNRGIGADWLAKKGVLYAKLSINDTTHAHVFTTHTQASYGEVVITQPDVKRRLSQLFEFHNFLEHILPKHRQPGEPVILTGDFNVDSRSHVLSNPQEVKYEREVEDGVNTSDEAGAMFSILNGHGIEPKLLGPDNKDTFKGKRAIEFHDLLKERLGYHPVTFGNIAVDEKGIVHPRETVLTTRHDNEVMHSIDYILWHNPDHDKQADGVVASVKDVGVTPNFTPGHIFTQISDHYGVSAEIQFESK
ncbi:hypothetical protein GGI12_005097 [Dipsacomyces acuminosporus]|nr:hypothetical protein GGI12_005097 [Dipsacomyces acuminosporus]